jgi:hypothetical protein
VLVDDREKLRETWEEAGGHFVHHTSAKETIKELRKLGII